MSNNSEVKLKTIQRMDKNSVVVGPRNREVKEAEIQIEQVGDVVSKIHFTCKCGHKVAVQCQYQNSEVAQ